MDDPFEVVEGTREEILAAAFRALCEYGYANLTVERIGDELGKSPSLVYHHYEGKDELLVDLLEYLLDRFETTADLPGDPRERIEFLLKWGFDSEAKGRTNRFLQALVELRAQAAHDDAYRAHFDRSDDVVTSLLAEAVREGIDDGSFRDVDPREFAAAAQTAILGGMFRRVTTGDPDWLDRSREEVEQYLEARLYEEPRAD